MTFQKKLLEARINSLKCEIANSQKIDDVYKKYLKLKLIDMNAKYELLENHKSVSVYIYNIFRNIKEIYF